jgi:hypothetical protein
MSQWQKAKCNVRTKESRCQLDARESGHPYRRKKKKGRLEGYSIANAILEGEIPMKMNARK